MTRELHELERVVDDLGDCHVGDLRHLAKMVEREEKTFCHPNLTCIVVARLLRAAANVLEAEAEDDTGVTESEGG